MPISFRKVLLTITALALVLAACGQAAPSLSRAASSANQTGTAGLPSEPAASAASPSGLTQLNASYTAAGTVAGPPLIAKGAGFFEREGLEVTLPFVSPATLTAGLIGGSVDTGYGSPGSLAAAVAQHADLAIIGTLYEGSIFSIVARSDIKTLKDLKGKKIGATQRGATTDFLIRKVAQEQGFGPSDVNVVYIPDQAAQVSGLSSGALDAAVLTEPITSIAIAQGNHEIFGPSSQGASEFVSMSVIIAKRSYIASHRNVLERFLTANMGAIHIMKTDLDTAVKHLAPALKMDDSQVLRKSIESVRPVLREDLMPSTQGLQSVLDNTATTDPAVAKLKPQDLVDLSLLNDIKSNHSSPA